MDALWLYRSSSSLKHNPDPPDDPPDSLFKFFGIKNIKNKIEKTGKKSTHQCSNFVCVFRLTLKYLYIDNEGRAKE